MNSKVNLILMGDNFFVKIIFICFIEILQEGVFAPRVNTPSNKLLSERYSLKLCYL